MKQLSHAGTATQKHVILFLAANPPGTRRLSLDEEAHSITVSATIIGAGSAVLER